MIWCFGFWFFFPVAWMCPIWFNMDMFPWWFVLKILLSLRSVNIWILLHFPVIFWLGIASMNCGTNVGHFLPIMRICVLVLFLSGEARSHGLLFFWLGVIGHVVMLAVLGDDANRSNFWCKSCSHFKYIVFDEGVLWEIFFWCWKGINICASH